MDKVKLAAEKYEKGYNCAQAVLCAYADELGLDEQTAYKLAEGLGGGVGGMRQVCGAFSAAAMVISNYISSGSMDGKSKQQSYAAVRRAGEIFEESYGSVICKDILAKSPAPCKEKVERAVMALEKALEELK